MSNTDLNILDGPEAWHGDNLALDDRWRFHLNEADLVEIDAAVSAVRNAGKIWSDMTSKADFPLPGLASKLSKVANELENGCGLVNLKGIAVDAHGNADLNRIWYGIFLNLGTPIYQNYRGELLRDIVDER